MPINASAFYNKPTLNNLEKKFQVNETIPPIYPASVDFFTKEIARVSQTHVDNTLAIEELLQSVSKADELKKVLQTMSN